MTQNKNVGEKKQQFQKWFTGDHVLVHVDARDQRVEVPANFKTNHSLTLELSPLFQGPTDYDDERVVALLKFSGEYFRCVLPWESIWGMTSSSGEQKLWPEDLPREVATQFAVNKLREIGAKIIGKQEAQKAKISEGETEEVEAEKKTTRARPQLRRVK